MSRATVKYACPEVEMSDDGARYRRTTNYKIPFTRYNWLSHRLNNRFDNRMDVCIHDTTSSPTEMGTAAPPPIFGRCLYNLLSTGCIV